MNLGYRRMETTVVASLACLAFVLPASAAAESSQYPPDAGARGFGAGLAGWTASTSFDGSCLPPLLCPSATNTHQPSGGADGGGHIRSAYQGVAGAMAVAGTTTAVFSSLSFTYRGVDGGVPTDVGFEMDRRASVAELLAVSGNSATYSVRLVDVTAGDEALTVIPPTTLAGASSWRRVNRASVDPADLSPGHEYRILIATAYTTGTGALVSGNADYDNVVLSADRGEGGTAAGRRRAGGGANVDGADRRHLADLVRAVTPETALLAGKGEAQRLLVRVRCPRKARRTCRITTQGMLRKRKPATARRKVKVRRGRGRLVTLRVKPKLLPRISKRKRLLVRQTVRAGKVTATVYKSRRLIRR